MRKSIPWAPWYGVLTTLLTLFYFFVPNASAKAFHKQSDPQEEKAPAQGQSAPPNSITIPDGTPLTLKLEENITSATAKVGDTVKFTTAFAVYISSLLIIPEGAPVSGTVMQVSHPRRGARDGQVKVMIERLILPSGEVATLRLDKSKDKKAKSRAMRAKSDPGPGFDTTDPTLDALILLTVPVWWPPAMLITKGHEQVYPVATSLNVYINGPLYLDRGAVTKWQPHYELGYPSAVDLLAQPRQGK